MPPREENNAQFSDDVRVGYVEVVFQCRDGDEATELGFVSKSCLNSDALLVPSGLRYITVTISLSKDLTYVLLHVLLSCIHSRLAHLEA